MSISLPRFDAFYFVFVFIFGKVISRLTLSRRIPAYLGCSTRFYCSLVSLAGFSLSPGPLISVFWLHHGERSQSHPFEIALFFLGGQRYSVRSAWTSDRCFRISVGVHLPSYRRCMTFLRCIYLSVDILLRILFCR